MTFRRLSLCLISSRQVAAARGLAAAVALITLGAWSPALAQAGPDVVPASEAEAREASEPAAPSAADDDPDQRRQRIAKTQRKRAKRAEARGDLDRAITLYRMALETYPAYPLVHNEVGVLLTRQGELLRARGAFLEALRLDPAFVAARSNLGEVARQLGDLDMARQAFERVVAVEDGNEDAWWTLAQVYGRLGQPAAQLWALDRYVVRIDDASAERAIQAGADMAALIRSGVEGAAPSTFAASKEDALAIAAAAGTGVDTDTVTGTEPSAADTGAGDAATEGARTADAREPGSEGLPRHEGDDAFASARYLEALEQYRAVWAAAGDGDVALAYKIGATHAVLGDLRTASRWWRLALELAPARPLVVHHLTLAAAASAPRAEGGPARRGVQASRDALAAGRPALALAALDGESGGEAAYLRGEASLRLGLFEAASTHFAEALELEGRPDDRDAVGGRAEAMLRAGDSEAARAPLGRWLGTSSDGEGDEDAALLPEAFVVLRADSVATRIRLGPAIGGSDDDEF